jgi:hypothetical protein
MKELAYVKQGLVSDPPGIELKKIGTLTSGLDVFRCLRGVYIYLLHLIKNN